MLKLGSLYSPGSTKEPDLESQSFELTRQRTKSTRRVSRCSSTSSYKSLAASQPIWKRASLRITGTVEVNVGEGDESGYFRSELDAEDTTSTVLGTEDPLVFQLFHNYLSKQEAPPAYVPNSYSDEPWRSLAAQAWVLGDHLDADEFMHYAFCQFLSNCALVDVSTWEFIETEALEGSTLRRFSNHWIAWNMSLAQTEYRSLKAASLSDQVSKNTGDPRTYQVDHWNLDCSDSLGSVCEHNTRTKKTVVGTVRRTFSGDEGRDYELAHLNGSNSSTSVSSPPPVRLRPSIPPSNPNPIRHRVLTPPSNTSRSSSPNPSTRSTWIDWHFKGRKLMAVISLFSIIVLGLAVGILISDSYYNSSIRYNTVTFSIFVACLNLVSCLLYMCMRDRFGIADLSVWILFYNGVCCVFLFSAGVATAKDASVCVSNESSSASVCMEASALSAFLWFDFLAYIILSWRLARR